MSLVYYKERTDGVMNIIIEFFRFIVSSKEATFAFMGTAWIISFGIAYIQCQLEEKKKWQEAQKARRRKDTDNAV